MADSEKILRDLIDKIAIEHGFSTFQVEIKPISSGGANYTSILFLITVTGDKDDLKLFAKVANIGEKFRETTSFKMYDTERFFYTKLADIYRELEAKYNVPVEHRINIPKFYGQNPNFLQETIVLEDLLSSGYSVYDRMISMDWTYASKSVEELAKLHALSYAYAKEKPDEFEEILKLLKNNNEVSEDQQKIFFEKSFKSAIEAADDEQRPKLINFTTKIDPNSFLEILQPLKSPVLTHGDYRISNQMYKMNEDGSIKIINMDFQTMQGGSPVTDIFYLIFTGTDEKFREQYYQQLLDHYYEQLCIALKRLNMSPEDVYSRKDFEEELKNGIWFLIMSIFLLPLVTVEAEHAPIIDENADVTTFSVDKVGDTYPERMRGIINDFVRWGILH